MLVIDGDGGVVTACAAMAEFDHVTRLSRSPMRRGSAMVLLIELEYVEQVDVPRLLTRNLYDTTSRSEQ